VAEVDVVVVGGGLSGLGAAAYLARAGMSVRLVERASAVGGRAATARVKGYSLNRGPHALYRTGEAYQVLRELGVPFAGRRPDVRGSALRDGQLSALPVDFLTLLRTRLLGWKAKQELAGLLSGVARLDTRELEGVSLSLWLARVLSHPESRDVLEAFCRLGTYAHQPEVFSAATAVRQLQKALGGVLYLDGGWQTLADGLAGVAEAAGARIECGVRVEALRRVGAREYEVELGEGRGLRASAVVLATPPQEAARLLESAGVTPPAGAAGAIPVRLATLDVALARLPRPGNRFALGIDRPLYFSVHSAAALLAPPGAALVHVSKYLRGDEPDPSSDRAELEALLDEMQPGWRSELVHAQYLPRIVVAERLDVAAEGGANGRPSSAVSELPGVFLAGDWVQGGSWLADASLGSARATGHALVAARGARRAVA
jgi:phytoene dehydrogenase-like protein